MSKPRVHPHAVAIIDVLETAGLRVGDHKAPKSSDGKIVTPCVVLYMLPSSQPFGSVGCPDTDVVMRCRLTAVDLTAEGVAHYADRVFDALDGADLVVEDRAIFNLHRDALAGITRDEDVQPPCFYAATPYKMMSMSASTSS